MEHFIQPLPYIFGPFLFVIVLLLIGFRPRKPYLIHAYMNKMFMKVGLVVGLMLGSIILCAYIYAVTILTPNEMPFPIFMTINFLIVGAGCTALIYVLYWSLPFSRKTTGMAAVDAAIARYKKPNEEVAGAWEPALIVDGKAYQLISYQGPKETPMAFDRQGNMVQDAELMQKISCCSQLAIQTARPDAINQRTSSYMSTQKGIKQLEVGLKNYDQWVKPLKKYGDITEKHIENVKKLLLLFQKYGPAVSKGWELEAEWGKQRGNAHLKEVRYEEMLELSRKINGHLNFLLEEADTISNGIDSAVEIQKIMKKNREIDRQSPNLKYLLELASVLMELNEIVKQTIEEGKKELPSKYGNGFKEDQVKLWRERLKWVDKVDAGKA